jgi:Cu+-exporting ATPase
LIKSGEYLEKAHKLTTVVFDKTGTLTKGRPTVTDIISLDNISEDEVLRLAASAESGSEHPLGRAVVEEARKRGLKVEEPKIFEVLPGKGVKAVLNGATVLVGNERLMEEYGIKTLPYSDDLAKLRREGKTVMMVAVEGRVVGMLGVADTLKENSAEAVRLLQSMGIEVAMLTGDNRTTAEAIARKLGIEKTFPEVLPGQKAEVIRKLKDAGEVVGMVGDGINDAPALAEADVGFAIGSGTDIAKEAGGIVLMRDDVTDVVKAIKLSKRVVRKIKQNLFWAFAYNVVLIPVAAGVLYPINGTLLNPIFAAIAMAASSITVTLNSMTLNR